MSKGPLNVRIWCDALWARKLDQLEWLADWDEARDLIQDMFPMTLEDGRQVPMTVLAYACYHRLELDRIRFLVERVGAVAGELSLLCAMRAVPRDYQRADWATVWYLESRGAEYEDVDYVIEHLKKLILRSSEDDMSPVLDFAWRYMNLLEDIPKWKNLLRLVRYRANRAESAALVVTGMYKRGVYNKDVARLIGNYVLAQQMDEKWGKPFSIVVVNHLNVGAHIVFFIFFLWTLYCLWFLIMAQMDGSERKRVE